MLGLGLGVPAVAARRRGVGAPPPPAAPELVAASGAAGAVTTSFAIAAPAETAAGDLLVVYMASDSNRLITSTGSGWTRILSQLNGNNMRGSIFWKIADGTDDFTASTDIAVGHSIIIAAFRNVNTIELGGVVVSGFTGSPDPGALTLSEEREAIWCACALSNMPTPNFSTPPADYTDEVVVNNTTVGSSDRASAAVAFRSLTATSQDPGAWVSNTGYSVALTLAVYSA